MIMKKVFVIILILIGLLGTVSFLGHSVQQLKSENERLQTNLEYYSAFQTENIILRHTIEELEQSKDSLMQKIIEVQKQLQLKPKTIKEIVYVETVVRDTLIETVPMTVDFDVTFTPNDQTSIEVSRRDSLLTVIPDIRNSQTVFVFEETRYRYATFWKRLIHFNWKKTTTNKYSIDNSNDLIQISDTRFIEIIE